VADPTFVVEMGFRNDAGPLSRSTARGMVDVSNYFVNGRITYGRNTKIDRFRAGSFVGRFDNSDRRFDPLYQNGPYTKSYLNFIGDDVNDYASIADSADLSITSDISVVVKVRMDDWTPIFGGRDIIGKWTPTGNQQSWRIILDAGGTLTWNWSTTGADAFTATSAALPVTDGEWLWLLVTFQVNNGAAGRTAKFYYADGDREDFNLLMGDINEWTLLSTVTSAGVTSIFDSTAPVRIGSTAGTAVGWAGRCSYASISSGLLPVSVLKEEVDFGMGATPGASSHDGWTLNADASIMFEETRVQPLIPVRVTFTHNSVSYVLFSGFAESFTQTYDGPNLGWMVVRSLDALEILNSFMMPDSPYEYEILLDGPGAYWPLTERGGLRANDKSGNDYHGTYKKRPDPAATLVLGDRGGAKHFNGYDNGVSVSAAGARINVDANDWAVEMWCLLPTLDQLPAAAETGTHQILFQQGGTVGTDDTVVVSYVGRNGITAAGQMVFHYDSSGIAAYNQTTTTAEYCDGEIHHIVFGRRGGTAYVRIDDTAPSLTSLFSYAQNTSTGIRLGGNIGPTTDATDFYGTLQHVAVWPTGLSTTQVTNHYTVGTEAWSGDTAMERVTRILDMVGIPNEAGWRAIDTGGQTFGPTSFAAEESALDYLQDVEVSEQGMIYTTPAGVITAKNRTNTAATPSNNHTFTDSQTTANLPYTMKGFGYRWNRDSIVNRVVIEDDESGAVTIKENAASIRKYGKRSRKYRRGMAADDTALQALADTLLTNQSSPSIRLDDVTVNPRTAVPDGGSWTVNGMWAAILGLAINEGITVKRTPQAVGSEISTACRVQGWTFDFEAKKFLATISVSEV
jgi:hypothetical protein